MNAIRVALFGISRSGKNYTIEDFLYRAGEAGLHFIHLSPMDMIRERLDGRRLRDMSLEEKTRLVEEVRYEIRRISESNNVIVDEHYCYPSSFGGKVLENGYFDEKLPHEIIRDDDRNAYEVVFPSSEYDEYDLILCMEMDPLIIVDRCRTSEGVKKNDFITAEDADRWQRMEVWGAFKEGHTVMGGSLITDPKRSGEQVFSAVMTYLDRRKNSFYRE